MNDKTTLTKLRIIFVGNEMGDELLALWNDAGLRFIKIKAHRLPHYLYQETGQLFEEVWENPVWNAVSYANMVGQMSDQFAGTDNPELQAE